MGTGKKEAARKVRQGKTGDGMANVKVKGENFYRYVMPAKFIFSHKKFHGVNDMNADWLLQLCEESESFEYVQRRKGAT